MTSSDPSDQRQLRDGVAEELAKLTPSEYRHLMRLVAPDKYPPSYADWWQARVPHRLHEWQRVHLSPLIERWACEEGVRIAVHAPPRYGKSQGTTEGGIPYVFGCDPMETAWLICHNVKHAKQFGATIVDIMHSSVFRNMFPRAEGAAVPLGSSSETFKTAARQALLMSDASFTAGGITGTMVGIGPAKIMIDDPYASPKHAESKAINDNTIRVIVSTILSTRVTDRSSVFLMFHRYHPSDVMAEVMARLDLGFEFYRFPAVADDNEDGCDPTGRAPGELLSPMRTRAALQKIETKDPVTFAGVYQGRPVMPGGTFIRREWLREVDQAPASDVYVRYYDLSVGKNQTNDLIAGAFGTTNTTQDLYLVDMAWFREQWGTAFDTILEQLVADKVWCDAIGVRYYAGVEEVFWQDAMIQDLYKATEDCWSCPECRHVNVALSENKTIGICGGCGIVKPEDARSLGIQLIPVKPIGDKKVRASPWVARARRTHFHLVRGAWDMQGFKDEAAVFDGLGLRHDDQIDAVSGMYALLWEMMGRDPDDEPDQEPEEDDTHGIIQRLKEIAAQGRDGHDDPDY